MKRKEEIQQAMKEAVCETIYSSGYGFTPQATDLLECAFTKGAEWADKTMFKKAYEFFKPRLIAFIGREDAEEVIAEFRQAMEGGAE